MRSGAATGCPRSEANGERGRVGRDAARRAVDGSEDGPGKSNGLGRLPFPFQLVLKLL